MNFYICEICGDAYIGTEKPSDCPFCGAKGNFIKPASESQPIINIKEKISELSKKNLMETLDLETRASAIYTCMAGKAEEYKIQKMYKRLAKVELEHAIIVTKLLSIAMPQINPESCSDQDEDNFQKTIELEDHATQLYKKFAGVAAEEHIRKFFGALIQVEQGHVELMKGIM
ncbi:MAG TPA: ferritin family protein [Candidatus Moranbacteria bacterium]|nr:ferritin family protein [Candidatus Moranbacteria bacterium]